MKNRFLRILSLGVLLGAVGMAACSPSASSSSTSDSSEASPSDSTAKPVIRIASTEDTVSVGKQITIRVLVTGTTMRDVTYTSSDPSVATIDSKGTLTGLKEGQTTVRATLNADATVYAEVLITVEPAVAPTSIEIAGEAEQNGWIGETVTLEVTASPDNADPRVSYSTSDSQVATVDEQGVVSFLAKGEVTITATSTSAPSIKDSVLFHVNESAYLTNYSNYGLNFNYATQLGEDSYIESNPVIEGDNSPAMAWFKATPSKHYYAEANIEFVNATSDAWTRVGIGSGTGDMDTRAFYFSDKEGQKTVMMDYPNMWGAATARSMIWQVNDIRSLDKTDITLGVLRDGDDYYYTINGEMYWFEHTDRFTDKDTLPVIVAKDVQCKVRVPKVITDEAELDQMAASADFQKVFFESATNQKNVILKGDKDVEFTNEGTPEEIRLRDQCIKSYGDKGTLSGDFYLEFDLAGYGNDPTDNSSMLGAAFRRYNTDPAIMDSIMVDEQSFHFRTWDYENQFTAITSGTQTVNTDAFPTPVAEMETAKVRIERRVDKEGGKSVFTVKLNGTEYKAEGKNIEVAYIGDYNLIFGANNAKGHVTNLTFGSLSA